MRKFYVSFPVISVEAVTHEEAAEKAWQELKHSRIRTVVAPVIMVERVSEVSIPVEVEP